MNRTWLINLSLAFEGSRYLSGASLAPDIYASDEFLMDA